MYCTTKRKIADCVKELVRKEEIRKITVQDIMHGTNMSRQSFYYHFQDIYDVLEWIGIHDFMEMDSHTAEQDTGAWVLGLVHVLRADDAFYGRIVREIHWPELLGCIRRLILARTAQIWGGCGREWQSGDTGDWQSGQYLFATSLSYYLMEYVYQKRKIADRQVLQEIQFVTKALERTAACQPRAVCVREAVK